MAMGNEATRRDWGLAVLRVIVGIVFFMHGWQKFFDMGVAGVSGFFGSLGIPMAGIMAPFVSALETIGGGMLAIGLLTRWVALLLAFDMLVATLLVHLPNGFYIGAGGVEFTLLLMAAAVALALAGPGAFSVEGALHRRRAGTATTAGTV